MEPVLGLRRSPRCGEASAGLCAFASGSKTLAIPVLLCTPLCPSYGTSTHFSVSLGLLQWCCLSADWLYLGAGASVYALNSRTPRSAARALRGAGPPQFAARGHAQTHAAAAAASAPNFAAPRRHNTDAPAAGVDSAKKGHRTRAPPPRRPKKMASFAGSSKDTVADLLVDKSASPPPGAKPAKAPDTEKKHYPSNNDGETMEALLEGPTAASRRSRHRLRE